jgi:molybdate transport system substrate-binding protein
MKTKLIGLFLVALLAFSIPLGASAESLQLYAAGSLKQALGDVAAAYEKTYQVQVTTRFGPSGLLRKAIEEGERPDLFASANMTHPEKLAAAGWGGPVALFVRNQLCGLAQPGLKVGGETFLSTLLDPKVKVGTSTPKADPSGDYAWELFQKADGLKAGSFATLSAKALQLTGGPDSPKPPGGRNPYGWVMSEKKADVFLTYCTNAVSAQKEVEGLTIVRIPGELAVGADYGLLVRKDAPAEAWRLAMFILSPAGQKILRDYGFEAAAIPK